MKSWKRITLAVFGLIGGTTYFGYWSFSEINVALNRLSSSYTASVLPAFHVYKANSHSLDAEDTSTTSLEVSFALATSTQIAVGSATSSESFATATSSPKFKLILTSPQKSDELYGGCEYRVSWQASSTISSLAVALVDADTGKNIATTTSGLIKENTIKAGQEDFAWKVGAVPSGTYYISVSKINGFETQTKSGFFAVNPMPKDINTKGQEALCRVSGGVL